MSTLPYAVEFAVMVDHPELRNDSYPQVAAGRVLGQRIEFRTQRAAVALFEAILRGEEDFASEFVVRVQVVRLNPRGGSPVWVRRPAERKRKSIQPLGDYSQAEERVFIGDLGRASGARSARTCAGELVKYRWLGIELCATRGVGPAGKGRPAALSSGSAVYALVKEHMPELLHATQEHIIVVPVDTKNFPLAFADVSVGTLGSAIGHPRELLQPVLLTPAHAFILIHNHPSGDPSPSQEDIVLTRRMAEAGKVLGVRLLDHVVVASDGYVSLADMGLVPA